MNNFNNNSDIFMNVYNPGVKGNFTLKIKVAQKGYQVYENNKKLLTDIICNNDDCDLYLMSNQRVCKLIII